MPPSLTYPGVYIEEVSSGVRPITGVATSIAAFIGKTARGNVNQPFTITSFAEYEREFGPLDMKYPVGFSVRAFYENGGGTAIVVRAFRKQQAGGDPAVIAFTKDAKTLELEAKSPGTWAKGLRIRVEHDATKEGELKEFAQSLGLADATTLFNLRIFDTATKSEVAVFNNLTAEPTARDIRGVLAGDANSPFKVRTVTPAGAPVHDVPQTDEQKTNTWQDPPTFSTGVTNANALTDSGTLDDTALEAAMNGLDHADLFNLLVIPPPETIDGEVSAAMRGKAAEYCKKRRAFYIADPPNEWNSVATAVAMADLGISGPPARYAAVYYPRVKMANPLHGGQIEVFSASGAIAGVMARTDTSRGVWKAPAGVDAALAGVQGLDINPPMSDDQNGLLNPLGINALRYFPIIGHIVWGARTLRGADLLGDEYKYVPVRRTANFIEESLFRGLKWVVFEPNDEPLWAQIRLNVGAFMQGLFRQGAFQGTSARDAYFVACDKTTTTQNDINLGIVNVVVGFAPLKPAEFVVLKIQQIAGQIQT